MRSQSRRQARKEVHELTRRSDGGFRASGRTYFGRITAIGSYDVDITATGGKEYTVHKSLVFSG